MAATGSRALTRSDIEAWDFTHLETAATHWSTAAQESESRFTTIHAGMLRPGGTDWTGTAADAAVESAWGDVAKVRGVGNALYAAAGHATLGAGDLTWAKQQALTAIVDAEAAGFIVEEDLSVRDSTVFGAPSRQLQAIAFARAIQAKVQALAALDKKVAAQITSALAPLETVQFPEHGKRDGDPAVRMVDYGFKQEPPPPGPGAPQPPGGWSPDPVMEDAQRIAYGHAWRDHLDDWKGMTQEDLAKAVHDMLTGDPRTDPSLRVGAIPGRLSTAIYKDGIIVIHDPLTGDGGTVYRPDKGFDEFLRLIGGAGAAAPVISAPPNLPPTVPHPIQDPLPPLIPHAPVVLPPLPADPAGLPPWLVNPSPPPMPVSPSGPLIFPNTRLPDLTAAGQATVPAATVGGLGLAAILGMLLLSPG